MKNKITNKKIYKLSKVIIYKEGNFSNIDFNKLNLPFELFLKLSLMRKKDLLNNCYKIINSTEL